MLVEYTLTLSPQRDHLQQNMYQHHPLNCLIDYELGDRDTPRCGTYRIAFTLQVKESIRKAEGPAVIIFSAGRMTFPTDIHELAFWNQPKRASRQYTYLKITRTRVY